MQNDAGAFARTKLIRSCLEICTWDPTNVGRALHPKINILIGFSLKRLYFVDYKFEWRGFNIRTKEKPWHFFYKDSWFREGVTTQFVPIQDSGLIRTQRRTDLLCDHKAQVSSPLTYHQVVPRAEHHWLNHSYSNSGLSTLHLTSLLQNLTYSCTVLVLFLTS